MKKNLFRGKSTKITNFLSAIGGVKETHLTGILGYLFSLEPAIAISLFKLKHDIREINIESRTVGSTDRQDIVLLTSDKSQHCIEAKLETHSTAQIDRYYKNYDHVHLIASSNRVPSALSKLTKTIVSWQQVADLITTYQKRKSCSGPAKNVIDNLLIHLKESDMIDNDFKDIYIRDLSGPSVETYFGLNFYQCQPKYFKAVSKCRYFAPYLSKSNQRGKRESIFKVLGNGISYFGKIKKVELLENRQIASFLKENGYSKSQIDQIFENSVSLKRNGRQEKTVMLLENPIRLVQKPVTKQDLFGNKHGAIIYAVDFGELMAAASGVVRPKKAA